MARGRPLRLLRLLFLFILAPSVADAGGGFVREEGSLYSKLSYGYFRSNDFFTLEGELRDQGREFEQQRVNLYAEYGLLEWLTFEVNLPILGLHAFEQSEQISGLGDVRIGAKAGTLVEGFALAGGIAVELPTGRDRVFAALDGDPNNRINLPTGDGEPNVWFRLGASRSFPEIRTYVSIDAGYNLRTENVLSEQITGGFTDQLELGLEIGHHLLERIWLSAWVRSLFTLGEGAQTGGSFIYAEGTEFVSAGAGAAFRVAGPLSVTFDYSNIFANRRNVYGGSTFTGGLAFEL